MCSIPRHENLIGAYAGGMMVRCHGLLGKHDLSVSANGEIACSKCKRRWDPHNNGQEILPYGYKSWEDWHKEGLQKHHGQTIYPGSRPETHYGGYDTRLSHEEVAAVFAEHIIKANKMDDQDRTKQIRQLAKKDPGEFLRQLFKP
jgi:hypothetical protein